MEKTIGILGGMGPYAGLDFHRQILDHTPAEKDWDHFHILHDMAVKIPSRTRAILGKGDNPVPDMIEAINNLATAGADFVVVPCNSAHYFYKHITPEIRIPWLNIIEITAKKIIESGYQKPLILGGYVTIHHKTYNTHIENAVYLTPEQNEIIHGPEGLGGIIGEIKQTGKLSTESRQQFETLLEKNKDQFDCVVLACTELPIAYPENELNGIPLVNPNLEYVKATIKFAQG